MRSSCSIVEAKCCWLSGQPCGLSLGSQTGRFDWRHLPFFFGPVDHILLDVAGTRPSSARRVDTLDAGQLLGGIRYSVFPGAVQVFDFFSGVVLFSQVRSDREAAEEPPDQLVDVLAQVHVDVHGFIVRGKELGLRGSAWVFESRVLVHQRCRCRGRNQALSGGQMGSKVSPRGGCNSGLSRLQTGWGRLQAVVRVIVERMTAHPISVHAGGGGTPRPIAEAQHWPKSLLDAAKAGIDRRCCGFPTDVPSSWPIKALA